MESRHLAVALDGVENLLGSWRNQERRFERNAAFKRLLGDRCRSSHVLVRGVGAAADKGVGEVIGILLVFYFLGKRRKRPREIRGVRPDHVGFKRREVDLDDAVKVALRIGEHLRIGAQVIAHTVGKGGDIGAA